MTIAQDQASGQRKFQQLTVRPSTIEVGDWVRDLGKYRQVKSVEALGDHVISSKRYSVCFTDDAEGEYPTLGIPESVSVTVWREV